MLIIQKSGNLSSLNTSGKHVDVLDLEWHETNKRILHKKTRSGRELKLRFLKENQNLQEGDVLFEDASSIIAIEILPCETIVLNPKTMYEMAFICYEIGNKHLPLFYEDEKLLIPFEAPIYNMLTASGFNPSREHRKLLNQLRTSVAAHPHSNSSGESLFSKIMKLTSNG